MRDRRCLDAGCRKPPEAEESENDEEGNGSHRDFAADHNYG